MIRPLRTELATRARLKMKIQFHETLAALAVTAVLLPMQA